MKDEKILVTKSLLPPYDYYCEKIKSIWNNSWLTNCGPLHQKLESELCSFLNVGSLALYANGHLALENALELLDVKGEIITTPFTFVSTTSAIVRTGNSPVFCDINPTDYTIDVEKIEELITDKTIAILPVHVYGNVCNVKAIAKIAKKYDLKVIYDAAHAFGVKYHGKSVACYGDISMFSFHATKVFNTIEGGGLALNDTNLKEKAEALKNFGIINYEETGLIGGNAKMNEFQAAMGLCNMKYLDESIRKRKKVVELYIELLNGVEGIILNRMSEDTESNYAYFPIKVEDSFRMSRDDLFDLLNENGIFARKYFYPISNQLKAYSHYYGNTPVARDLSKRILTLPLYPDLGEENVKKICSVIRG